MAVTAVYQSVETAVAGAGLGYGLRTAKLTITGLSTPAANTIAHGLPGTPLQVFYVPTSGNGNWYETQAADATNLYITTGSGSGPTSFVAYVTY